MAITYRWANPEKTSLIREGGSTDPSLIFVGGTSDAYLEFVASGAEAAPYVAPTEPEPLTAQQKLENAGLTVDELKTLLGI